MSESGTLPPKNDGQIQGNATATEFSQGKASHVVEQKPMMRSVGISTSTSFYGDVETRKNRIHTQPLNVGVLRHPQGHSDPLFPSIFQKHGKPSQLIPKPPVEVQFWIVDDALLRSPPTDFPLVRTRRKFQGLKLCDAARRISRCFHSRSIKAEYSKTEILATCRNVDFVHFTVRIYLDKDGILVIAQRKCGDGISFMQDYRAIISACEGESVENFTPLSTKYLTPPEPVISTSTKGVDSIQFVACLLASEKLDAKMLGLESLVSLSDPAKTIKATSHICARSLLCHEKRSNGFFDLHNFLMGVILHGYQSDFALKSPLDEAPLLNYAEKMRHLALQAISHALELLKNDDCFKQIVHGSHWYREVFVPSLVDQVSMAKQRPHDACFACRCLLHLASSSDFAEKIKEEGGLMALEAAGQVGDSEFALLASEVDKLQKKLK